MVDWQQALRLCLVVGPSEIEGHWLTVVDQAIAAGVTSVQLREKNLPETEVMQLAQALQQRLPRHVPLIINDHVAIAKALKLALHIGQHDCPYEQARAELGPNATIGLSIENIIQAQQCQSIGVDYFGVGPVFATSSKPDAAPVLGVSQANAIVELLRPTPVVFIGGINQSNLLQCQQAAGVAVISAITQSVNPSEATRQMTREYYEAT